MPDETGKSGGNRKGDAAARDGDLDRRREILGKALAGRTPPPGKSDEKPATSSNAAGFATALKMSSEFVAGVLVGAAIGWAIDYFAGTSPWGMIIFLLLGFCAGILNVLRSAGLVAEQSSRRDGADAPKGK